MKRETTKRRARRKNANGYAGVLCSEVRTLSKITNNDGMVPEVDARSQWSRRFRDLVNMHSSDLGGSAALSQGQKALIRRAALLETELEFSEMHVGLAREDGKEPAQSRLDQYRQMTETLRRLLETLDLHKGRRARDVTHAARERDRNTARILDAIKAGNVEEYAA